MRFGIGLVIAAALSAATFSGAHAQSAAVAAPAPEKSIGTEGKWTLKDGTPTYNVEADGKMDWFTYSGFRRYHSECHVCHGPEAQGSTYAPALVDSVKTMDYSSFVGVVAGGQQNVRYQGNSIMPALGDNKNVMCYIDDIYIYVKALSDNAISRGRPGSRVDKAAAQGENEKVCLGG
jgi:methanol metabolism-related c-type cytochrome